MRLICFQLSLNELPQGETFEELRLDMAAKTPLIIKTLWVQTLRNMNKSGPNTKMSQWFAIT